MLPSSSVPFDPLARPGSAPIVPDPTLRGLQAASGPARALPVAAADVRSWAQRQEEFRHAIQPQDATLFEALRPPTSSRPRGFLAWLLGRRSLAHEHHDARLRVAVVRLAPPADAGPLRDLPPWLGRSVADCLRSDPTVGPWTRDRVFDRVSQAFAQADPGRAAELGAALFDLTRRHDGVVSELRLALMRAGLVLTDDQCEAACAGLVAGLTARGIHQAGQAYRDTLDEIAHLANVPRTADGKSGRAVRENLAGALHHLDLLGQAIAGDPQGLGTLRALLLRDVESLRNRLVARYREAVLLSFVRPGGSGQTGEELVAGLSLAAEEDHLTPVQREQLMKPFLQGRTALSWVSGWAEQLSDFRSGPGTVRERRDALDAVLETYRWLASVGLLDEAALEALTLEAEPLRQELRTACGWLDALAALVRPEDGLQPRREAVRALRVTIEQSLAGSDAKSGRPGVWHPAEREALLAQIEALDGHLSSAIDLTADLARLEADAGDLASLTSAQGALRQRLDLLLQSLALKEGEALLARSIALARLCQIEGEVRSSLAQLDADRSIALGPLEGRRAPLLRRAVALASRLEALPAHRRAGLAPAVAALHEALSLREDIALAQITQWFAGITVDPGAPVVAEPVARVQAWLDDCRESIALSPALDARAAMRVTMALEAAHEDLALLRTREADLAALRKTCPRLAGLVGALATPAYLEAMRSLRFMREQVVDMGRPQLDRLLEWMLVDRVAVERLLLPVHRGDAVAVDALLQAPQWREDAFRIKWAFLEQQARREVRLAEAEHAADTPARAGALRAIEARLAHASHTLEVQHLRRTVAYQLDKAMQMASLAESGTLLPVGLFDATRPSAAQIRWLMAHAPKVMQANSLLLGAWISLALYDPETGRVDAAQVDALLKTALAGSEGKGMSAARVLGLEGYDAAAIQAAVLQGFVSVDQVRACCDRLTTFARSLQDTTLMNAVSAQIFPRERAADLVKLMFEQLTGLSTEVVTHKTMDEALAATVSAALPWITLEAEAARLKDDIRLGLESLGAEGEASAKGRRWMAKPAVWLDDDKRALKHREDLARAGEFLRVDARVSAYQARLVASGPSALTPEEHLDLTASTATRDERLRELHGFYPDELRRDAFRFGEWLKRDQLADRLRGARGDIEVALRLPEQLARSRELEARIAQGRKSRKQAHAVLDRVVDLVRLQEIHATVDAQGRRIAGAPSQEALVQRVMDRLATLGVPIESRDAFVRRYVRDTGRRLSAEGMDLVSLNRSAGRAMEPSKPQKVLSLLRGRTPASAPRKPAPLASGGSSRALAPAATPSAPSKAAPSSAAAPAGSSSSASVAPDGEAAAPVTQAARDRAEFDGILQRQLELLQPGQMFEIGKGCGGSFSIPGPVLPFVEARLSLAARVGSRLACARTDEGYTVACTMGQSATQGVALATSGEVLTVSAAGTLERESGYQLAFARLEDCRDFVAALVQGDEVGPHLLRARGVMSARRETKSASAGVEAVADLRVAQLTASVSAEAGWTTTVRQSRGLVIETQQRSTDLRAGAQAELVAGLGGAGHEVGRHRATTREIARRNGLVQAESRLMRSVELVSGEPGRLIEVLVPPPGLLAPEAAKARHQAWLKEVLVEVGEVEPGTAFSLVHAMAPAARQQANDWLGQAAGLLLKAAVSPSQAEAARAEARSLVQRAEALMARGDSWTPVALEWTVSLSARESKSLGVGYLDAVGQSATRRQLPLPA